MAEGQQLTVIAQFRARTGAEDVVKEALSRVVAPTRREDGNIRYDLYQATDDPSLFVLHESWTGQDALDQHLQEPYLQEMLATVTAALAEPFGAIPLTPIDVQDHV